MSKQAEIPGTIANRIANDELLLSRERKHLASAIEKELKARDQRAARIIKEHRESDICRDNCWTTITNQILGKDGNKDAK